MRTVAVLALICCVLLTVADTGEARESRGRDLRIRQDWSRDEFAAEDLPDIDYLVPEVFTSSAVDTYDIVWYDFEQMNWQGWRQRDMTAQVDSFWHVEDYLEPELAGLPGPLEGAKSAWCGAPPGLFEYMCGWDAAPGYGNLWEQFLVTDRIYFESPLRFSYHGYFDSEPKYDQTTVEYDRGAGNWVEISAYDGVVDTIAVHELFLSQASTKLRFRFVSDDVESDEDGMHDTDGAAHIDSITIEDNTGIIDYEDFEAATDGVCRSGIWHADVPYPFGVSSGLYNNLADEDPCNDNYATQMVFFIWDSPVPPPDWQWYTPFCHGPGAKEAPCQSDLVYSPIIDMTMYSSNRDEVQDTPIPPGVLPDLGGALLHFTVYRDLPISNLVGYEWWIRNIDVETGCPGPWLSRNFAYFGASKNYHFQIEEFGDLVTSDYIQVGLYVHDYCDEWYQVFGDCEEHTMSPWFDNVFVQRYTQVGPQWSWRDLDIFQDNFPEEEFNIESYVRADAANDLHQIDDPVFDPGDSIVVTCTSPLGGGIDTTLDGWPKVYMHVHCEYIGDPLSPKPDLYGPDLEGSYGRYVSDDGEWTILQCNYAGHGCCVSPHIYGCDLNDSLFTRGYEIVYYFKAYDVAGHSTTLPERAEQFPWPPPGPPWTRILHWQPGFYFFEWTCLPTLASDVLYVDDFHGRGTADGVAHHYWESAFRYVVPPYNQPDRYDVNAPSSCRSNGPGSRAKNYHMTTAYTTVLWDSGNLSTCTISEGTDYSDKSNDAQMLVDWMEFSPHNVGLWVCGDDVAQDLDGAMSAVALQLLATYCGVNHIDDSYFELAGGLIGGGVVNPLVTAVEDVQNPLWHTYWGDSFYVFGGCPSINSFDVLETTGGSGHALRYPDFGGQPYYAGIYNAGINSAGYDIRTMWFGFSFMYLRDVELDAPIVRNIVFDNVFLWFWHDVNCFITETDDVPLVNTLAQNFPNPFNPSTTIRFGVKEKGRVTLRVYDVAGRLVRTLVDEVRDAGSYREVWDGTNKHGSGVASGVYFYRMNAKGFEQTRKMVILK
jgi:hypothetical protein